MGFFSKITKIVTAPIRVPVKAITGKDPIKDFVGTTKALPKGIKNVLTFPLRAGQKVIGAALGGGVPAGQQLIVTGVPNPVNTAPSDGVPINRGAISGGAAAFSSFSPFAGTGGNPAWDFSRGSQAQSVRSGVLQGPSQGRWLVSGSSVRLLA